MRATRRAFAATLAFVISLTLGGCVLFGAEPIDPRKRLENAESLAAAGGFERLRPSTDKTGGPPVAVWVRPGATRQCVRVYIEGDGLAWQSRHRVSMDPTPVDPTGLRLALADPSQATLVYLARPCQYEGANTAACHPIDWTDGRFGDLVLESMDARLDDVIGSHPEADLTLIGFSGGGVVAALLSARREDVDRLVTIAAPLDLEDWARTQGFPPLVSSHSPIDAIADLRSLPQDHFAGTEDRRVAVSTIQHFHAALGPDAPSRFHRVEGAGHGDWPERWGRLLAGLGPLCGD